MENADICAFTLWTAIFTLLGGTPCMVFPLEWHISSALQKEGTPLLPILRMRRRHGATA